MSHLNIAFDRYASNTIGTVMHCHFGNKLTGRPHRDASTFEWLER